MTIHHPYLHLLNLPPRVIQLNLQRPPLVLGARQPALRLVPRPPLRRRRRLGGREPSARRSRVVLEPAERLAAKRPFFGYGLL